MTPNDQGAIVESYLPGRIRVRLPREQRQYGLFADVRSLLLGVEGIKSVSTNLKTGSVLVEYDADAMDIDQLIALGQAAGIIGDLSDVIPNGPEDMALPGRSVVGSKITTTMRRVDGEIHWLTKGFLDGKTLFPLLLIGLAAGRAVLAEKPMPTPWYALFWYGYSLFMHWNSPNKDTEGGSSAAI